MFEPGCIFIVNHCIVCLYLLISTWTLYIDMQMCWLFGRDVLLDVPHFCDLMFSHFSLSSGNVQFVVSGKTLFDVPPCKGNSL